MAVTLQRSGAVVSIIGRLPSNDKDAERYMSALHEISAQIGPYVLLVDLGMELDLSREQRKAQNLWYKADRPRIEAACKACALVRPAADENMQRMWQGLFSFPILVTRSREEAERFLARHAPGELANVEPS
jgi:hypothetical protein